LDNRRRMAPVSAIKSATMRRMRHSLRSLVALGAFAFYAAALPAQGGTGGVEISARITPTGAHPEPVRQFDLFILTRSYADVIKEIEGQDVLPSKEKFIDGLKVSPELKKWMKAHDVIDLTAPDVDQLFTPDDLINVPEVFAAYLRANSGGATVGFPNPKYRAADKDSNPDRYQKQKEEYLAAIRKFIESHPSSAQGVGTELAAVSPKYAWDQMHSEHNRRVAQLAPETAQVKYLAGKTETDLVGHAIINGLPPGNYWVSSLGMDAAAGDRRLVWDVPLKVQAGQTTRLELSNLNAVDSRRASAP
jgi:hypothetical protein